MALVQRVSASCFLLLVSFSSAYLILPDPKAVGETDTLLSREIRRAPTESKQDEFFAYCTDVVFPNDIVCDMREFKRQGRWLELQPMNFTGLQFEYEASSRSYDTCSFVYKPKDPRTLERFVYDGIECIFTEGNVAMPKGKKTSDFKEIMIVSNKPDNISYQCTFSGVSVSKFRGQVKERGRRFNSRQVKYRFKDFGCVLSISIGREIVTTTKSPCVRDRRGRCRPNNH